MRKLLLENQLINYINTYILYNENIIPKKNQKGGSLFEVTYEKHRYVFESLHDDENKLALYSYDGNNDDCVILTINKDIKVINIDTFGSVSKCYHGEINIGSNLLQITLKMIKKYRRVFGINTVSLSDNSTLTCKTGEKIEMNKMMVLLTGDSWYGKYGFRPYNKEYKLHNVNNKIYKENKKIMLTKLVKTVDIKKYLLMINKKYPEELTLEKINWIIEKEKLNEEKLLISFMNDLFNKKLFNFTCKYLYIIYEKLYNDIGLKNSGHVYGLSYSS